MKTIMQAEVKGDLLREALADLTEKIHPAKRYFVTVEEFESVDHRAVNYPHLEPEYRHDIGGTEMPLMREDV